MTKNTRLNEIKEFETAVRNNLKGLTASEISELTEGLEADLNAQAAEQGTKFKLPDPVEYAAELRTAAGFSSVKKANPLAWLDNLGGKTARLIGKNRTLSAIFEFVRIFQPTWWLGRAYFAFIIVDRFIFDGNGFIPGGLAEWTVLVLFAFLSIQLGRGVFNLKTPMKRTITLLNLFAVAITPILGYGLLVTARDMVVAYQQPQLDWQPAQGLKLNGTQVDNIFVYDENGHPLKDVQLFMQNGDPLTTEYNMDDSYPWFQNGDENYVYIKSQRVGGAAGWNVYPLRALSGEDFNDYELGKPVDDKIVDVPLPFPNATPLNPIILK